MAYEKYYYFFLLRPENIFSGSIHRRQHKKISSLIWPNFFLTSCPTPILIDEVGVVRLSIKKN